MAPLSTIRAVTNRLTTTPVNDLPQFASLLAASLSECGHLLTASSTGKNLNPSSPVSDNSMQLHKLKSRLTSLLQDRSVEGRWTAVVLIKTVVEAGQWEVLHESEAWVRGLLAVLARPDLVSTKKLAIITLTRIFHSTYRYPTLVREITTPNLPAFITASLNLVSVKPSSDPQRNLKLDTPLLETVLQAFNTLISRHPTVFRPFSGQIHSILVRIIGCTSYQCAFTPHVRRLTQRLFVALHVCAPKNTSGEEWLDALRSTIASAHRAADYTFRAVIEQWESEDPNFRHMPRKQNPTVVVGDDNVDALGLLSWKGIHGGLTRLSILLQLVVAFITQRSARTIALPLGAILDLTSRLLSVVVLDTDAAAELAGVKMNPEIAKEEFEELQFELPGVHMECLSLFSALTASLGAGSLSISRNIIEQVVWIFEAEKSNRRLRTASYQLLSILLPLIGPSLTKLEVATLAPLIRFCCHDAFPFNPTSKPHDSQTDTGNETKGKQDCSSTNVDSFFNPNLKSGNQNGENDNAVFAGLNTEALRLLKNLLTNLPVANIPLPLRVELDRAAILSSQKDVMLASVLNPVPLVNCQKITPSLLPFLVQRHSKTLEVELLLRPRMPVLLGPTNNVGSFKFQNEDSAQDGASLDERLDVSDHDFVPHSLSAPFTPAASFPSQTQLFSKRQLSEEATLPAQLSEISSGAIKKARLGKPTTSLVLEKPVSATRNACTTNPAALAAASPASDSTFPHLSNSIFDQQVIPVSLSENHHSPAAAIPPIIVTHTGEQHGLKEANSLQRHTFIAKQVEGDNKGDEDDSGEDIPTLNIEPDTDDDGY